MARKRASWNPSTAPGGLVKKKDLGMGVVSGAIPVLHFQQVSIRYDIGELKSPRRMADGRLIVDAKLTRTGVFDYMNPDGTMRREYRPPNEVFDTASLATFAMTSVTNDHPPEMVNVENAKEFTVGMVANQPRRIKDHIAAELVIFDSVAIGDIESGKLELSCGYEAEVDPTPGISPEGIRYDSIQRNIRINHVAIVDVGRAGPEARIRMDGATQVQTPTPTPKSDSMNIEQALKRIADLEVEKASETARADRAEGERDTAVARADKAEGERDAEKAKAEAAEKARLDAVDGVAEAAKVRAQLCFDAKRVDAELDADSLTDREIKVAVVKKVCDFDVTADHSDDYLAARFDGALEIFNQSEAAHGEAREAAEQSRKDGAETGESRVDAARKRMLERQKNAHKKASK